MSAFQDIKEYINTKEVDECFSRQELLRIYEVEGTVDSYRRKFQICGYIDSVEPGFFAVKEKIPEDMTSSRLDAELQIAKLQPKWSLKNHRPKLKLRDCFRGVGTWIKYTVKIK